MITKGIVEQIDRNNPYTAKVRIPVFNKAQGVVGATPTNQLYTASICCLPNCNPNIKVGDVVYVSFEDNYIDKPIILGHLYNGVSNLNTTVGLKTDSVEATVTARFPADTNIGNTTPNDFVNLQGTRSQLQGQIDEIVSQYNSLDNKVDVVTAPKPWINGGDLIDVKRYKQNGQLNPRANEPFYPSCSLCLATINLLYIEITNLQLTTYDRAYYFSFNLKDNISNITEDQRTFMSYFNKIKQQISVTAISKTPSASLSNDQTPMVISLAELTSGDFANINNSYLLKVVNNPDYLRQGHADEEVADVPFGFFFLLKD